MIEEQQVSSMRSMLFCDNVDVACIRMDRLVGGLVGFLFSWTRFEKCKYSTPVHLCTVTP